MIYVACKQGEPEWFAERIGVVTASRCKDARDRLKSGDFSQKAKDYAAQVAFERVVQETCDDTYVTYAMRRGQELEPDARFAYEAKHGGTVTEAGVVLTDDRFFGYSTDGLVDEHGLIEVKCPLSPRVILGVLGTGDLSDYMDQMMMGMWISGRRWCDFIMYDPRLRAIGRHLYVRRIERDDNYIEQMESDLIEFKALVDRNEELLRDDARKAA